MKLFLPLAAITLSLVSQISAYGVRGAAERVAWFAAYLAEDEYISKFGGEHTIGVGCTGSAPKGRCSLLEFCKHFWVNQADPRAGEQLLTRKNSVLDAITTIEKFNKAGVDRMVNGIVSYSQRYTYIDDENKPQEKAHKLTGNIVAEKVVKDLHTYWDVVTQATKPIGIYRNLVESDKLKSFDSKMNDISQDFIRHADSSVHRVHELRLEDYEGDAKRGRVKAIRDNLKWILNTDNDLVTTRTFQTRSNYVTAIETLDADASLQRIEQHFPGQGESALQKAHDTWMKTTRNAEHDKALRGAQSALKACGCEAPPGPAFAGHSR